MPRTSTSDLASIEIQLPPIHDQEKFAGLFVAFDAEIAQLLNSLERTATLRSGLLSELLSGDKEIPQSYDQVMSHPQ
jgi:restriction endonuclease S subunit